MAASFKLTKDFILHFLNEAAAGNPKPLIDAIEPDVKWRIGSEKKDAIAKTGIYNLQSWMEEVSGPLQSKLKDGLKLEAVGVDILGNKAHVELKGYATQNNGRPYDNFYFWVLIFNDQGRIAEIREYLDTGFAREVIENN